MLAFSAALVGSVVAAVASLAGAVFTALVGQRVKRRNDEHVEQVKATLAEAQAERQALRDYRYDALKKLYTDLQPLLFQLSELCESAYRHTRALARTARAGDLGDGADSWLRDDYYLLSTVYRLLVPTAVVRLMHRRLTLVDLSLDQDIRTQYRYSRALVGAWNSGFDLAAKEPALEYRPHERGAAKRARSDPAVFGLQHLYAGQIDQIVRCLVQEDAGQQPRYRTYGEFEEHYRAGGKAARQMAPALELFSTFHPRTHPVLWRMLIAQAHLQRAIGGTFAAEPGVVVRPAEAFPDDERARFDWREPSAPETEDEALGAPFRAAEAYLAEALGGA